MQYDALNTGISSLWLGYQKAVLMKVQSCTHLHRIYTEVTDIQGVPEVCAESKGMFLNLGI